MPPNQDVTPNTRVEGDRRRQEKIRIRIARRFEMLCAALSAGEKAARQARGKAARCHAWKAVMVCWSIAECRPDV